MSNRRPMVYARVEPELFRQVEAEAERRYGGNQSLVLRESVTLYIRLRRKLGPQFEPTMALLLGESHNGAVAESEPDLAEAAS